MKTWCRKVLVLLCMTVPAWASAQETRTDGGVRPSADVPQKQGQRLHNKPNMYRGSKIIGADIVDPQDKKLGEIKDILLDSERGEVAFVVASFGGALGLGSKYLAIPWRALQPGDNARHYVLYADRETISKAPAFDQRNWPDLSDQKWSSEVESYWARMVGNRPPDSISSSSGASSSSPAKARANGQVLQPSRQNRKELE